MQCSFEHSSQSLEQHKYSRVDLLSDPWSFEHSTQSLEQHKYSRADLFLILVLTSTQWGWKYIWRLLLCYICQSSARLADFSIVSWTMFLLSLRVFHTKDGKALHRPPSLNNQIDIFTMYIIISNNAKALASYLRRGEAFLFKNLTQARWGRGALVYILDSRKKRKEGKSMQHYRESKAR